MNMNMNNVMDSVIEMKTRNNIINCNDKYETLLVKQTERSENKTINKYYEKLLNIVGLFAATGVCILICVCISIGVCVIANYCLFK